MFNVVALCLSVWSLSVSLSCFGCYVDDYGLFESCLVVCLAIPNEGNPVYPPAVTTSNAFPGRIPPAKRIMKSHHTPLLKLVPSLIIHLFASLDSPFRIQFVSISYAATLLLEKIPWSMLPHNSRCSITCLIGDLAAEELSAALLEQRVCCSLSTVLVARFENDVDYYPLTNNNTHGSVFQKTTRSV